MIRLLSILIFTLFLSSCFKTEVENTAVEVKNNIQTGTVVSQTGESLSGDILPVNEKSSKAEQEFSSDLNNLFNLVEQSPNE